MPKTVQGFAGYAFEELVGESRMGAIYRARDIRLQRPVALRIVAADLTADPVTRARLNRELTTLAALDHPNVPPIYEAGERDGQIFVASRWVEGVSVSTLVAEEGPLEPRRAVRIVNQVAAAVQAAHDLGIMHRNVKPSTVLVTPTDHAYLTDFGLARRPSDMTGLTVQDQLLESFDYVAPEYIAGQEVDARVDIYGLGCVLYEALTAEVPYPRASNAAKMYAHLSEEPPSPREHHAAVPEMLDGVVRRALAKDPGARQQSASQFSVEAAGAVGLSAPLWAHAGGVGGSSLDEASAADPRSAVDGAAVDGHQVEAPVGDGHVGDWHALDGSMPDPHPADRDGAGAAPAGAGSPVRTSGEYYDPIYFEAERQADPRVVLWLVALLAFLAAPIALIIALAH